MDEGIPESTKPQPQEGKSTTPATTVEDQATGPLSDAPPEFASPKSAPTPQVDASPTVADAERPSEPRRISLIWAKVRNLQIVNAVLAGTAIVACVFTAFELREMQRQGELTRDSLKLTKDSLQLTQDGLLATKESNLIAARAAAAAEDQARLTRDQLKQGTAQLELGRRANAIAVDNSRQERRAWLTIKSASIITLAPGHPAVAQLHITNSGLTPALNVRIAANLHGAASYRASSGPVLYDTTWSTLIIAPGVTSTSLTATDEPVTSDYMGSFRAGRTRLFASGTVHYQDVFQRPHETHFCSMLGNEQFELFAAKRIDVLALVACPEHNEIR